MTNAQDGSGLETTVNLFLLGEKEKQAEVIFENKYEKIIPPEKLGPPKPPTEGPTEDKFEQTSTSFIGLGLFVLLSMLGLGFIVSKKKK